MGAIEDHNIYGLTVRESATDGSDFTNPGADYRRLFLGEDGQLHVKDSAGAVTDIGAGSGSVATDAIWDAAGDLVQGTGANTSARLALGAAGTVVRSTGSTNAYAFPPGHEFDYVEKTSSTSVTAASEGTADVVVTGSAVAYDGSTPVWVEFYAVAMQPDATAGASLSVIIYDSVGTTSIGRIAYAQTTASAALFVPVHVRRKVTPSAATHTYSIRAYLGATGTGSIPAGTGGAGVNMPAFIRITKA